MAGVYTRTGDKGSTSLFGGTRLPKQAPAVEAYGTVDEANCAIGVAKAWLFDEYHDVLAEMQQRLFILAAELASDDRGRAKLSNTICQRDIDSLESLIDSCLEFTGQQKSFVVPGRDPASSYLHMARTISRRAERRILSLLESAPVRPELIMYMNRLSDALFSIARVEEVKHDRDVIERIVREAVAKVMRTAVHGNAPTEHITLDLSTAKALAEAAEAQASEMGVPIVFAAVDFGGNLILAHRMADSLLASVDIAINKAYTSASLKTPTAALREAAGPSGPLYGIEASNHGRLILLGGGLPIMCGGVLLGGIGVSGGTVEQDVTIITHAYHTVYRELT